MKIASAYLPHALQHPVGVHALLLVPAADHVHQGGRAVDVRQVHLVCLDLKRQIRQYNYYSGQTQYVRPNFDFR